MPLEGLYSLFSGMFPHALCCSYKNGVTLNFLQRGLLFRVVPGLLTMACLKLYHFH